MVLNLNSQVLANPAAILIARIVLARIVNRMETRTTMVPSPINPALVNPAAILIAHPVIASQLEIRTARKDNIPLL